MNPSIEEKVEMMLDYILKKCLWQFHSRVWDRERQNQGVLSKTSELLCEEPVKTDTPEDRCYWVDAVCLVDAYRQRFPWLASMGKGEIKELMALLKEKLDFVTITGSLNAELTDQHY